MKHFRSILHINHLFLTSVIIVLTLSIVSCLYVGTNRAPSQCDFYNKRIVEIVEHPITKINKVVNMLNLQYSNKPIEAKESAKNFKWVFNAEGAALTPPVVDPVDGDIFTVTTDIDVELDVKNQTVNIGTLHSNLYALTPGSSKRRRSGTNNKKWEFNDILGAVVFAPVVSNDSTIIVETIDATFDIENNVEGDIISRLYAFTQEGKNKWGEPISFKNKIFTTPPFVGADDTVFTNAVDIISTNDDIQIHDLKSTVSAIDPSSGAVKWTFDPTDLAGDVPMITICSPETNKAGDTIFISALSPLTDERVNKLVNETVKMAGGDVAELVDGTINEIVNQIKKGNDFTTVTDSFTDKTKAALNETAKDTVTELLEMTTVFALESKTGNIKWQSRLPGLNFSSPIVVNNSELHVGNVNFLVDSPLNVDVQEVKFDKADPDNTIEMLFKVKPIALNEIEGTQFGTLNSIKISDGDTLWIKDLAAPVLLSPVASIDGNQTIVGTTDFSLNTEEKDGSSIKDLSSQIYAIDVKDGNVAWESKTFSGMLGASPIDLLNNHPILTGKDGSLYFTTFNLEISDEGIPSISADVRALSSDGSSKWSNTFTPDGFLIYSPKISDKANSIFLSTNDSLSLSRSLEQEFSSKFISLNLDNGSINKSIEMDGISISSTAVDDTNDVVYSTTSNYSIKKRPLSLDLFSLIHAVDQN